MLVKDGGYGFVLRGRLGYSVPISPLADMPNPTCEQIPFCGQYTAKQKDLWDLIKDFCCKHKLLCIGAGIALLCLLTHNKEVVVVEKGKG